MQWVVIDAGPSGDDERIVGYVHGESLRLIKAFLGDKFYNRYKIKDKANLLIIKLDLCSPSVRALAEISGEIHLFAQDLLQSMSVMLFRAEADLARILTLNRELHDCTRVPYQAPELVARLNAAKQNAFEASIELHKLKEQLEYKEENAT